MGNVEDILKTLNEYFQNKPCRDLEESESSLELDSSEFYAYWGILRSLPKEELLNAKEIIDREKYAEILSYVLKRGIPTLLL